MEPIQVCKPVWKQEITCVEPIQVLKTWAIQGNNLRGAHTGYWNMYDTGNNLRGAHHGSQNLYDTGSVSRNLCDAGYCVLHTGK